MVDEPGNTPSGDHSDPPPPPLSHDSPPAGPPPLDNPPPAGGAGFGGPMSDKDARLFAMLSHLLGIFTCFVGPLIIWAVKKEENAFVADQSKEALNFQITVLIGYGIIFVLSGLLAPIGIGCVISLAGIAVGIAALIFSIIGSIAANEGKTYRYPFAVRLVK